MGFVDIKLKRNNSFIVVMGVVFGAFTEGVHAITFILDDTNGYSVEVAPGFTIAQPEFDSPTLPQRSFVEFSNASVAFGDSSVADFTQFTFDQIGNGVRPNGFILEDFVELGTALTIRDNTTLQLYDTLITYGRSANGGSTFGTAPTPDNNAGLVIQLTPAAIPEPSSALLIGLGTLGLIARRKRAN